MTSCNVATLSRCDRRTPALRHLLLSASIAVSLLAGSSTPTALYSLYAERWGFSVITTTVVFGTYAIAVLISLLFLGRLSDYLGRRPVILATLALQVVAMAVFVFADGIATLLLARVLQGVGTGAALGALGAMMIDIDRVRGMIANAASPGLGSGAGALASGLFVEFLPAPTQLVFIVLAGTFVVQGIGVYRMPETVTYTPGVRSSLRPVLAVPNTLRGAALTAAPILFATWAVAGFYGSLGPALARELSGSASGVVASLGLMLLATVSSITTVVLDRVPPRVVMVIGIWFMLVATVGTALSMEKRWVSAYFVCIALAGVGFGAGFQGGIRSVVPLAEPRQRAGALSLMFIFCYLGMGVPSVAVGFEVVHGDGLMVAARHYSIFILVLCSVSLSSLVLLKRCGGR